MAFKRAGVRRRTGVLFQSLEARVYMCADGDEDSQFGTGLPPIAATTVSNDANTQTASGSLFPLTSVPALASDPGTPATLYLDFHGEPAQAWGGQTVPATPAYTTDSDATTFSSQELANMQEIWARVSEAYSPFNVNVTTVDPGNWNLTGNGSSNHQLRAVIGGDGSWTGGLMGGIAYVGSYYQSWVPNTVYVFPVNLANGAPQYTAEDTVHEFGHGFGLQHQSTYNGTTKSSEYNTGNGTTAPFMGNPLSPGIRATWWYGQSSVSSTTMQDDLGVLSGSQNGFGYRTLLYGQSKFAASGLSFASDGSFTKGGIVETTSQGDYFSFTTYNPGSASFSVNVAQYGPMLHAILELHDASDNVIASATSASTLSQTLTATLSPGTYYLVVKSYGQYGDIGQYTVSGTVAGWQPPASATISGATSAMTGATYTLGLAEVDAGHAVTGWTVDWGDGTTPQLVVGNPSSVDHTYASDGNYSISATMTDDAGASYVSNTVGVASSANPPPPPPQDNTPIDPLIQPVVIGNLPVKGKKKAAGKFASTGATNLYEFTVTQQQVVVFRLNGGKPGLAVQLTDADGNEIWAKTGKRAVTGTLTLGPGTYDLQFTYLGAMPTTFSLTEITKPMIAKAKHRV